MTVADGIKNLHFSPNESGCGQAGGEEPRASIGE